MATNAQWLATANRMINASPQTFNKIVLTEISGIDPITNVGTVIATDTIDRALVSDFTNFERQADGVGLTDRKVLFANNPRNTKMSNSLSCTVNGVDVNIVNVKEDPANATIELHVSNK
tara:strand:+ start:5388 stop:5744 length:357 start_codon:yes stop_codon:yes gene_type:complete